MNFSKSLSKIKSLLRHLFVTLPFEKRERRFIHHNRKVWKEFRIRSAPKGEILVEVFPPASSIIAQSYLANCLAQKHQAEIVGFTPNRSAFLKKIYNFRYRRIYRSFNTARFFYVDISRSQKRAAQARAKEILNVLKSKRDVENLVVDGVWIGDLLYDSHLMNHRVPTIDLNDPRFFESVIGAVSYYLFWKDYLERNAVKAVLVSHCSYYENGLIARLCAAKNIPCYQAHAPSLYFIDEKRDRAYLDYLYDLPKRFRSLSSEEQRAGIAFAKERLEMRFKGVVGVDMPYSTKSGYGEKKRERLLREGDGIKVLIAPHCFFDSPHPYGNNLFPDFYEWLGFLGELSNRTDYEWYIKTHADVLPENFPVIESLAKKFPKFILLPPESSHNQLIEEGIDVVLTVYGTIGMEYAARGIPVINASIHNPHIAYKFNIHAGDVKEYERLLMNLGDLKLSINKDEVYEYYFARNFPRANNWLFNDYEQFTKDMGGYGRALQPVSYEYFLNEFTPKKHEEIIANLNVFIDSKEYRLIKPRLRMAAAFQMACAAP